MSYYLNLFSESNKTSADTFRQDDAMSITSHDLSFKNLVSDAAERVALINTLSQSPEFTSNPDTLYITQNLIGQYTNDISLISALARKAVSTIETLGKSQ